MDIKYDLNGCLFGSKFPQPLVGLNVSRRTPRQYCLQCFTSETVHSNHKENYIIINGAQAIKMPKTEDMLYFENHHKALAAPFVVHADSEAVTEKVHGCQPNNDKSYTDPH